MAILVSNVKFIIWFWRLEFNKIGFNQMLPDHDFKIVLNICYSLSHEENPYEALDILITSDLSISANFLLIL